MSSTILTPKQIAERRRHAIQETKKQWQVLPISEMLRRVRELAAALKGDVESAGRAKSKLNNLFANFCYAEAKNSPLICPLHFKEGVNADGEPTFYSKPIRRINYSTTECDCPCQCRIIAGRDWYLPDVVQVEICRALSHKVYHGDLPLADEPMRCIWSRARAAIMRKRVAAKRSPFHPGDLATLPDVKHVARLAIHGDNGERATVAGPIGTTEAVMLAAEDREMRRVLKNQRKAQRLREVAEAALRRAAA